MPGMAPLRLDKAPPVFLFEMALGVCLVTPSYEIPACARLPLHTYWLCLMMETCLDNHKKRSETVKLGTAKKFRTRGERSDPDWFR